MHSANPSKLPLSMLVAILIGLIWHQDLRAQHEWTNPAGGFYDVAANWSVGTTPGASDSVIFNISPPGGYEVEWNAITGNRELQELGLGFGSGDVTFHSTSGTTGNPFSLTAKEARLRGGSLILGKSPTESIVLNLTSEAFSGPPGVEVATPGTLSVRHGSELNVEGDASVRGILDVQSGSQVNLGSSSPATLDVTSGGEVRLNGIGTRLKSDRMRLGVSSSGTLTMSDGAFYEASNFQTGGGIAGDPSIVISASELKVTSNLLMQQGDLSLNDGGVISADLFKSSSGAVVDIMNASSLTASTIEVGRADTLGTINVSGGSRVESVDTFIGTSDAVSTTGPSGIVNVSGAGSQWIADELFIVGNLNSGTGTLTVSDQAEMKSGTSILGAEAGTLGQVTIRGDGTTWETVGGLTVGQAGIGKFTIENAARVEAAEAVIGEFAGAEGDVHIRGAGSRLQVAGEMEIGVAGVGVVRLSDGGRLGSTGSISLGDTGSIRLDTGIIDGVSVFNAGTIIATGNSRIDASVNLVAAGELRTEVGSTMISGPLTHNGATIFTALDTVTHFNGATTGAGSFSGEGLVSIDSVYAPGNSAAAVSFEGDLALGFASVLEIELGGTGAGEFDRLLIDGDLDIGDLSQLDVSLIDGFDLGFGQEFLFADVEGSLNGVFNGLSEGATVGNYGGQDLFITYNGFGGNAGVGLFTAVPEPSSVLTLVFIGMGAMLRRKRAATVVGSQVT